MRTRSNATGSQAAPGRRFFGAQPAHTSNFFSASPFSIAAHTRQETAEDEAAGRGAPIIQTKLMMGAPGDRFEVEADSTADRVVQRMHSGAMRPTAVPSVQANAGCQEEERLQRQAEQDEAPDELVQAKAEGPMDVPGSVQQALEGGTGGGTTMHAPLRDEMESAFGADFSGVRIHTGSSAEHLSRDIRAHAFTYGQDIFFNAGEYRPETPDGRHLLAHELTHVVQQSGPSRAGLGEKGVKKLQRDEKDAPSGEVVVRGTVYILPNVGGAEEVEKELLRRRILAPGDYDSWGFLGEGYYFGQSTGSGPTFKHFRVVDALYIRNDNHDITGYRVISYLQPRGPAGDPSVGSQAQDTVSQKTPVPPPTSKPKANKPAPSPKPVTPAVSKPTGPAPSQTTEQMQAEFKALPDSIKDLLLGTKPLRLEDLPQLLRIAKRLAQLQPEDLAMYKLLAKSLAADLDSFERSVEFFIQFKEKIKAQAAAEKKAGATAKEPSLEEKLSKTWSRFDETKFSGMSAAEKEAVARDIAAEQRNIQLEYMASHPGETAVGMAEGMVRLDKTAKAIAEDVKDAADGSKGAYTRIAGAVGAYNKYLAAAASIVFIALLFVPGVNLIELAAAGLAVAAASIALSYAESELRIKAAGEATTPEELKSQTAKSAAAQTQAVVTAGMIALTLAAKIIARIPLPGRYQNVGAALKAGQAALAEKSGVAPAWRSIKADLLSKLRTSKQGLPEALAGQSKTMAETAKAVEGMSGDEFVKQLADGDPKLADLGIPPDEAKAIKQLSSTPEGKKIAEQLRQDSLKALQDAPVEAGKKVDRFLNNVDDAIAKMENAASEEQLKTAVDDASAHLGPEEQAKQAVADEQSFVKKRLESARRSGVRELAQKRLEDLQPAKAKTQAEITRLEEELSKAETKVNRLKNQAQDSPRGSPERAKALEDFRAAKEELKKLTDEDALGGYKEERAKQNKLEEDILASLELKRPSLWQSTKDAIKKAAKTNSEGKFLDANTGEVIEGEPVYGHKYGRENRRLILEASAKGMTQEQFAKWVNDHPEWFQTETKANNESHRFEKPGVD